MKIAIIFTGGTFSMKIDPHTGGAIPFFHGEDLIKLIPEAGRMCELEILNFGNYPGPHITPELMLELSFLVRETSERDDINGIIVTHGTDTLEETAYFLDLNVDTEKPVVIIGAMKTSSEKDWDGPRNLIDAIQIISNINSKGMGVLVCLNGEINAASEVTKTHTEELETFHSLDFGALGFVEKGRVIYNRIPRKQEKLLTDTINSNVDLITTYTGMSEKFLRYSADTGTEGIVIQAMGVGNVPPAVFDGVVYALKKNIPVILVSRCPAGETLDIYGYPGAGKWLKKEGVIFSEYLNGQKARIKLILALGISSDKNKLKEIFEN